MDESEVRIFAIADMGEWPSDGFADTDYEVKSPPSRLTTDALLRDLLALPSSSHAMVVHSGDISYARGYQAIWPSFFDQIEPVASRVPWMTTLGNHERDWPGSGDRFDPKDNVNDSGGECFGHDAAEHPTSPLSLSSSSLASFPFLSFPFLSFPFFCFPFFCFPFLSFALLSRND